MSIDSKIIFEKYIEALNESKMPKGTPRPDVILSRQHTQKTTMANNPDAAEAHGANIGKNQAMSLTQSDNIRDRNFETYISEDMSEGYYIALTGEESKVPKSSQKALKVLAKETPDNKYYKYIISGNLVIPYWNVPDCIEQFTINARTEKDPVIKKAFIDALVVMYTALSDKQTYNDVYRNCKPILRIMQEGGKRELFEVNDTYEEFAPKIINRVKALVGNPTIGIVLKPFLFHNHTKPRQQVKFGVDRYEDAIFLRSPDSGAHTIFGKTESEPRHEYAGTDPTYGVSTGANIREKDLEKIHIKDKEQSERTPVPTSSLRPTEKPKIKKPKKVKESYEGFIKNILF
jgi:hypothetical protein